MQNDLVEELTTIAIEAARIGGDVHRAGWRDGFAVHTKGVHGDAVTDIDVAAEEAIREYVLTARPRDSFFGEESPPRRQASEVSWIVDPIDGTANYLRHADTCAVSIGVQIDDNHTIGVVLQAATGDLWIGQPNGATLNGHPIAVARRQQLSDTVWATGFTLKPRDRSRQLTFFTQMMADVLDCRRTGSPALDLAHVADGTVDGYVEFGLGHEDYAGGVALVEAAGGSVDIIDISPWRGPLVIAASRPSLLREMRTIALEAGIPNLWGH